MPRPTTQHNTGIQQQQLNVHSVSDAKLRVNGKDIWCAKKPAPKIQKLCLYETQTNTKTKLVKQRLKAVVGQNCHK